MVNKRAGYSNPLWLILYSPYTSTGKTSTINMITKNLEDIFRPYNIKVDFRRITDINYGGDQTQFAVYMIYMKNKSKPKPLIFFLEIGGKYFQDVIMGKEFPKPADPRLIDILRKYGFYSAREILMVYYTHPMGLLEIFNKILKKKKEDSLGFEEKTIVYMRDFIDYIKRISGTILAHLGTRFSTTALEMNLRSSEGPMIRYALFITHIDDPAILDPSSEKGLFTVFSPLIWPSVLHEYMGEITDTKTLEDKSRLKFLKFKLGDIRENELNLDDKYLIFPLSKSLAKIGSKEERRYIQNEIARFRNRLEDFLKKFYNIRSNNNGTISSAIDTNILAMSFILEVRGKKETKYFPLYLLLQQLGNALLVGDTNPEKSTEAAAFVQRLVNMKDDLHVYLNKGKVKVFGKEVLLFVERDDVKDVFLDVLKNISNRVVNVELKLNPKYVYHLVKIWKAFLKAYGYEVDDSKLNGFYVFEGALPYIGAMPVFFGSFSKEVLEPRRNDPTISYLATITRLNVKMLLILVWNLIRGENTFPWVWDGNFWNDVYTVKIERVSEQAVTQPETKKINKEEEEIPPPIPIDEFADKKSMPEAKPMAIQASSMEKPSIPLPPVPDPSKVVSNSQTSINNQSNQPPVQSQAFIPQGPLQQFPSSQSGEVSNQGFQPSPQPPVSPSVQKPLQPPQPPKPPVSLNPRVELLSQLKQVLGYGSPLKRIGDKYQNQNPSAK